MLDSRFARIARWCSTHRWQTFLLWLAALIVTGILGSAIDAKQASNFRLPGTESQQAYDLLAEHSPAQNGVEDQFVFAAREGKVTDPVNREAVEGALRAMGAETDVVERVTSPFGEGGQLSRDERIAVARVLYKGDFDDLLADEIRPVQEAAFEARSPALQVEHGGQGGQLLRFEDQGGGTEGIGILVALVVLMITFGSVIAAGVPLVSALFAVGITIGLVPVISHVVSTPDFAGQLATLIGLGVGIDYALIVLTRYRAEVAHGYDRQEAVVRAIDTAGRTVFFAGCTVIIALLGLLLLGLSFLHGPALASALVVAMSMLSAVTLLPMLISRAGDWIDRVRIPLPRRHRDHRAEAAEAGVTSAGASPGWARWSAAVQRRPWVAIAVSLLVLVGLALPALDLRLGNADAGLDPRDSTTRQAYDLIAEGFGPGINASFLLVVDLPQTGEKAPAQAVEAAVKQTPGVAQTLPPQLSEDGEIATIMFFPTTGPQDEATTELLERLRGDVLPGVEEASGATVLVGGVTASQEDFTDVIAGKLPLFVGMVVLLSALLLLVVFRSIFIPIKAAAMNLLSIGAALGFVTLVFQEGFGADLLGAGEGPIESFVPVMLFAIVFGLSMDYEVFLISRVHEEWMKSGDASGAVRAGLATTGKVITAAAAIMVVVFLAFAIAPDRVIKEFGIGLAVAVFLDAVIIRCLLVPALMEVVGAKAWWIPGWLDRRLPHLALEREEPAG